MESNSDMSTREHSCSNICTFNNPVKVVSKLASGEDIGIWTTS